MSMAMALEYAAEYLRTQFSYKQNECGVTFDAIPAADAGPFYVAIDDAGVEPGNEDTDSLKEILTITIGIWRRPEHIMKDRRGMLKNPSDKYLAGAYTLNKMERDIIVPRLGGLHKNYTFMNGLNTRYSLPHDDLGASFITPLAYRGRGRMEMLGLVGTNDAVESWYGYRLRFRGLMRDQKLRGANDANG